MTRPPSDDAPFSALAFKIMTDPFVGSLTFCRIYSGTLEAGSYALNANKGKKERVGRLMMMHANNRCDGCKACVASMCPAAAYLSSLTVSALLVALSAQSFSIICPLSAHVLRRMHPHQLTL